MNNTETPRRDYYKLFIIHYSLFIEPPEHSAGGVSGGRGWIRTTEAETTDLQSAPFDRSGTLPFFKR